MKLYIPKYLQKIKVLDQLIKMYETYQTGSDSLGTPYKQSYSDPLENYNTYNSIDPVEKFLVTWIDKDKLEVEGMSSDSVIPYLVKRFYSLKGTSRVLKDLKQYFSLDIELEYNISSFKVGIKAGSDYINISEDAELFKSDLCDFLNELLYFNNIKIEIADITIDVLDEVETVVGAKFIPISVSTVTEED